MHRRWTRGRRNPPPCHAIAVTDGDGAFDLCECASCLRFVQPLGRVQLLRRPAGIRIRRCASSLPVGGADDSAMAGDRIVERFPYRSGHRRVSDSKLLHALSPVCLYSHAKDSGRPSYTRSGVERA